MRTELDPLQAAVRHTGEACEPHTFIILRGVQLNGLADAIMAACLLYAPGRSRRKINTTILHKEVISQLASWHDAR